LLRSALLLLVLASACSAGASEELYGRCAGCHSLEQNRTGPRHCDLVGRRAGSVPGFDYSEAMKRSGIVWTEKNLDRFLSNPLKMVPGTTMTYAGIGDPRERAELIAYLRSNPCPKP
jgi:cytochrome c